MTDEQRIELHSTECTCAGGSWVLFGGASGSPCAGAGPGGRGESVQLTMSEWRSLGKPPNAEAYRDAADRKGQGERREFARFEARLDVLLSRLASWKSPEPQTEQTVTEVIAQGGALVRTRMALDQGESILFQLGDYQTRAEVVYVNPGRDGDERFLRLGLRFLDAPLAKERIPPDARPI